MQLKKLLVVDDSALMRKHLTAIFEAEGDFDITTARNGIDAIEQARTFQPDVITLDVNMPEMDGLTALSRIMVEFPCPVVMVSSLTEQGALATFEALELGAIDYVAKPGGTVSLNIQKVAPILVEKVRAASTARIRKTRGLTQRIRQQQSVAGNNIGVIDTNQQASLPQRLAHVGSSLSSVGGVVLIGVSTGGPRTLEEILPYLPHDFKWPLVVAQHMPMNFTNAFAKRLDKICELNVMEVSKPTILSAGNIYIAKGDTDLVFSKRSSGLTALPAPPDPNKLWHPSIDRMVLSAIEIVPAKSLIGILLTGMGDDGAEAMTQIRKAQGHTIAETEETAVVFGMPNELIKRGGAELILRPEQIPSQLLKWIK